MTVAAGKGKARLDELLVARGLAESRTRAQALILAGERGLAEHDEVGDPVDEIRPRVEHLLQRVGAAERGDELGRQTGLGAGRRQLGGAQLGGDAGAVHAVGGGGGGRGVLTHEH